MDVIKTKSFELAINTKGDKSARKVAIVLPGRLDTKDYASCKSHIEYFADKGYFAVSFDPPGTWESPGGMELFTTTNYIKAVHETIEYYSHKPTLLLGHSRGGSTAILAGATHPSVIGLVCIMSSYGAPSAPSTKALEAGVQMEYRDLPPGIQKTDKKKEFALPLSYFTDGERYDVLSVLKTCTKPKLLFYGTRDKFNSPKRVREVFNMIAEPKMIHELNCDHDYRRHPEVIEEVNTVLGAFLPGLHF